MKSTLRIFFHQFYWSVIFGFVLGIFGISLSVIKIANFYISEGTGQKTDTYSFTIRNSEEQVLNDETLTLFKNVEGVAKVSPYFSPLEQIEAGISYLGFSASYPIKIKGIPLLDGISNVAPPQRNLWSSANLERLPVLLPQQAVSLYNNLAPQRGWPILKENAFIGIPGAFLKIGDTQLEAVIVGFDPNEFGNIVSVPAQTLFAVYNKLGLYPSYDSLVVESVSGLNRQQVRELAKNLVGLGYPLEESKKENFQIALFTRIKYTVGILGFGILIAFIILKFMSFRELLSKRQKQIWLYRVWGIPDHLSLIIIISMVIFSILCGIFAWIISFFAVIPAQEYIINALQTFGLNTPPLKTSAETALQTGFGATALFILITTIGSLLFYFSVRKANYIKKF
ncbi:MAG: hypothetical protein ACRCTJ_01075 [Brevinema sp.]